MKLAINRHLLFILLLLSANAFADPEGGDETTLVPTVTSDPGIAWQNNMLRRAVFGEQADPYNLVGRRYVGDGLGPIDPVVDPVTGPGVKVMGFNSIFNPVNQRNAVSTDPFGIGNISLYDINDLYLDDYSTQRRTSGFFWDIGPINYTPVNPNVSSDSEAFDDNGIFCPAEITPGVTRDIQAVGDATNVQECFDRRIPASARSTEEHYLRSDRNACDCLREKPYSSGIMNQSLAANTAIGTQELRNQIQNQVQEIVQNQLNSTMNGMFFTSAVIFNEGTLNGANQYGANVFTNQTASAENAPSLNLSYAPDYNKLFTDDYPLPQGQCVSKREYFQTRMIPQGRDMIYVRAVLDLGWREDKWDYKQLESRYRTLMDKTPRERAEYATKHEIISIKSRLKFLNRNPLLKYYFAANSETASQKQDLFNHLKTSLSDEGCREITSQCTEQFHGNLASFFQNENNRTIVRNEARADINQKARAEAQRDFVSEKEDFLRGRRERPRGRNDLIARFRENFKLSQTPDSCHRSQLRSPMDGPVAVQCMQIFSAYCKTVDEYQEALANSDSQFRGISDEDAADIADNLDDLLANDFNPNLQDNPDFREFNEENCGQRSRGRGLFRDNVDFAEFTQDRCREGDTAACSIRSHADLVRLRQAFYSTHPVARGKSVEVPAVSLSNGSMVREVGTERYFSPERPSYETFAGTSSEGQSSRSQSNSEIAYSNAEVTGTSRVDNLAGDRDRDQQQDFSYTNYSNIGGASAVAGTDTQGANVEPQRVQDMDQSRRQEMLEDWEREYNIWKERYGSDKSPATAAQDTQYRTEISTLRALLDQQRQISEQQFQLLNDAIAARTRLEQENLADAEERSRERRERPEGSSRSFDSSSVAAASSEEVVGRGPASIAEPQFNTSGASGGSSSSVGASVGGRAGGAAISGSGNSDSVAREQAKLDNIRTFSDGSIVISSRNTSAAPNAITVTVSGEELNLIRTNPDRIISQVQRDVTPEQLAELQQNGEVTVLVRTPNPNDPVYRMKLSKVNERLVVSYDSGTSGAPPAPMQRVYLRSSLENLTRELSQPAN